MTLGMDALAADLQSGGTFPRGSSVMGDDSASYASRGSRESAFSHKDEERAPVSGGSSSGGGGGGGEGGMYSPNAPPRGAIENARRFLWDEDEAAEAGMGLSSSAPDVATLTTRNIDWSSGSTLPSSALSGTNAGMTSTGNDTDPVGSLFGSKQLVPPSSSSSSSSNRGLDGSASASNSYYAGNRGSFMPGYSQGVASNLAPAAGHHFPRPEERQGSGSGSGSGSGGFLGGIGAKLSGMGRTRDGIQQSLLSLGGSNNGGGRMGMGMGRSNAGTNTTGSGSNISPRRPSDDPLELIEAIERSHSRERSSRRHRFGERGCNGARYAASELLVGCGRMCHSIASRPARACVALVVVVALVTGFVLLVSGGEGRDIGGGAVSATSSASSSSATSSSPESSTAKNVQTQPQQPQQHVVDPERFQQVRSRILDSNVSDMNDLDTPGTAQYQALKWISDWDGAKLAPDDEFLLQRYALAVFFFSTYVAAEVMDETGAEQFYEPNVIPGKGWKDSTHWMTSKGYCSWAGIKCHHRHGTDITDTVYDGNEGVTHLNLTSNNIRGYLPPEIATFADLRVLDLGQNGLTGVVPTEVGQLSQLVTLYLGDNDISGTIPTEIGKLTLVTHLYFDRNILEGTIPPEIGDMESMHMMGLYENYLTGPLPDLSKMKDLRALYLEDNDLTGQIPSTIGDLESLEDLRLGTNNFTGTIPPEISKLELLSTAYLEYNAITGEIPWQIYNLKELDELHLYENYLSGTIPYQFGELRDLEILYLDNNGLTGTIPATIGDCDDMNELFLHNNRLVGSIPAQIIHLKDLTHLRLDGNELTGRIPDNFNRLFKLERMYLNNNNFTGPVPDDLGSLKYLQVIRLHANAFTGIVPEGVCALREEHELQEFQADCGGTSPDIVCDCCTECFE